MQQTIDKARGKQDHSLSVYLRCGHRGVPAPVRTHWIGLDWIDKARKYVNSVPLK